MNFRTYTKVMIGHLRPHTQYRIISLLIMAGMTLGSLGTAQAAFQPAVNSAPMALTNTLTLQVVSAATRGDHTVNEGIPNYKFLINEDNTGNPTDTAADCRPELAPNPGNADLADCDWPSIRAVPGSAPVVTQGDQGDLASGLTLPPGRYLISVMADDFKLGGAHFTVPLANPGLVTVALQPDPLPLATMRIQVFEDNTSPNGQMDAPAELGLNGFEGRINDVLGEISTDWYGNPLCTEYQRNGSGDIIFDGDGLPIPITGTGGKCLSGDTNHDGVINGSDDPADRGLVVIPNIGSGRYAALVVPPDGTDWVQTTTLEGGHDWDTWLQEGATGYDTEFLFAGEPFPWTMFGFVKPKALSVSGSRQIKGTVVSISVYIPPQGGQPSPGGEWGGLSGARINGPVDRPYIALSDLNNGDQMIYMKRANANGTFTINNVPDGSYLLTVWDGPQTHLIDFYNVTVNGGNVDMGNVFLTGWFAHFQGSVFIDTDGDGKRDPSEKGLAGQEITIRSRGNNLVQHGAAILTTDANGYYDMENGYPFTSWEIMEVYNDRYYTTGITYKADNGPETTVLGQGVDVNILPIIGLGGRLDWGVKPYERGQNGGIVGTVTYDVTRNELDPRLAAAEDWQPSIPGMTVNLYHAVRNSDGTYATDPDGSYTKGALIESLETETWERPTGCTALDVDGNPVVQSALPTAADSDCLEAPMMGIQFGPNAADGNFGAAVDGNYGFGDLAPGDYLVEVVSPLDMFGKPLYKVTREEDINVFNGDTYTTQLPPPACAGALHKVDVAGVGPNGPNATDNPNFAAEGGSPFEGQMRPLCDVKLVRLQDSRSIAPTFNFFTDVPLPGRFLGYIVDDLNLSTDPRTTLFGEKAGLANVPVGVYDFADRLVTTIQSDPNGLWEILLPSTLQINCPTPSGVCSNMYRFVGNDPGQPPNRLNANHNPQYRTISANFEVWPGVINPADLAPTQIAVSIQSPGSQFNVLAACSLDVATPKLFAVSKPFVRSTESGTARRIVIYGNGFGATQGTGQVTLDTTVLSVVGWTNTQITITIPTASSSTRGPRQLMVRANNGQTTINGLTFHVLSGNGNSTGGGSGTVDGSNYNPRILTVNASPTFGSITNFTTIQAALTDAANGTGSARYLVVVFPGPTYTYNPTGMYFENLVMYSPLKLQGIGPGGVYTTGVNVLGTVIDGVGFTNDNPANDDWRVLVEGIPHGGTANVAEGEVIYVLPSTDEPFNANANYAAAIDGLTIQGGDQMGFPNNINQVGGGQSGGGQPQSQGFIETQGGGIYVHSDATNLRITNNILKSNGGSYGGAIRLGTPDVGDNNNDNIRILYNRILANGGTNLAGAIGLFTGSDGYEIASNDLCGNFSAEYGGAISHYGDSPDGAIHHNRIYFNQSYDEGGGIMLAGSLSAPAAGTGPVSIYNNLIQSNLGNDDGGGVRVLMSINDQINIYNNFIVNNISTDEGGGIALDTAANVRVMNNTIMKNLTTATAATSSGLPKPAGLTTNASSPNLVLFNNIFWDNRAGSWNGVTVGGIGLPTDAAPVRLLDLGIVGAGLLNPTNSVLNALTGTVSSPTNVLANPLVLAQYDTSVAVFPWRTNPNLVQAAIVAVDLPANLLGNYHLQNASPAINLGAASKSGVNAPTTDYDDQTRPANGCAFDSGADEVVTGPTCQFIHIGDLDASVSNQNATNWQATVTIIVHNASHNPVGAGVVVSGTWSVGGSGIVTCTTNGSGQCSVTRNGFSKTSVTSVNFTVSNATGGANVLYQAAPNHDPDSGSNASTGTTITINLPRMHIGDLDATVANDGATNWQATVTLSLHDTNHNAVQGAVISGTWSVGGSGIVTCTTNASGQCTVNRGGFSKTSVFSVNFTVSNVTHVGQAIGYQSSTNHDPDSGSNASNGTTITINLPRMHIGDLDARIANDGAANWQTTVTITVHDTSHNLVQGAVISGTWSVGGSGIVTCTTNALGQCIVTRGGFSKTSVGSVTFTVSNATHASQAIVYQSSTNHDPDGDSTGTAITITPIYMHVGDLDWRRSTLSASLWQAAVTVTVHTTAHGSVVNATVTGVWTNANGGPVLGTSTCVTNGAGQCTVTASLSRLDAAGASATFTITNVTMAGNTRLYRATNNHDPDASPQNSNGTTITVIRP